MRICLLSPESCHRGHGGIASYTYNLARGLARDHTVTVILPGPRGCYEEEGVRMRELALPPRARLPFGNRYFGQSLAAMPYILACRSEIRKLLGAVDVVESPEWMAGGSLLALEDQVPVVTRLHTHLKLVRRLNHLPVDADTLLLSQLERMLILRSSMVLANSEALAAECVRDHRIPERSIEVLPLGIDCKRFCPRLQPESEELSLLFVGRLERRKGVDTLLKAFVRISERFPQVTLYLAGESTGTGLANRDVREEILEGYQPWIERGRIRLLGPVSYDRIPALYAAADLLVAPSPFEPFGMIYLEGMASGKPVIGCRSGGVPEVVVHGKTGLLVPPSDPGCLADAMSRLLSNRDLRLDMGRQGRAHVLDHFSAEGIADRTLQCYERARMFWRLRRRLIHAESA